MRTFRTFWMLILGLVAVITGLGRHIIADLVGIPRPPGQYVVAGIGVVLAALAVAPMFLFRRR